MSDAQDDEARDAGSLSGAEAGAAGDDQAVAESLDWDKIDKRPEGGGGRGEAPFEDDDVLEDYPPDGPRGVDGLAITPAEELFPESQADRQARTVPDPLAVELDRAAESSELHRGSLVDRRDDEEDLAIEAGEVPDEAQWAEGEQVAHLASTTPLEDDDEGTMVAREAGGVGEMSAEEAAVHPTGSPPYRDDDSYVDDRDLDEG